MFLSYFGQCAAECSHDPTTIWDLKNEFLTFDPTARYRHFIYKIVVMNTVFKLYQIGKTVQVRFSSSAKVNVAQIGSRLPTFRDNLSI